MSVGTLIFALMLGGSAVKCGIDNVKAKNCSYTHDEQGRATWINRKGETYINGEKVVPKYDYQNDKLLQVGSKSGKVYYDPDEVTLRRARYWDEEAKRNELSMGNKAYLKYVPEFEKRMTCEIETEKFIAQLSKCYMKDGSYKYYKYYLDIDAIKPKNPNKFMPYTMEPTHPINMKMPGDEGIEITEEEYRKLNIICGTHGRRLSR